jgi:hypothetical protein
MIGSKPDTGGAPGAVSEAAEAAPGPAASRGPLRALVWNIPLGWQLTALYSLVLAVTLAVVGVVVYSQQEAFLV